MSSEDTQSGVDDAHPYDDLTVADVTVRFDEEGNVDTVHVGFVESSGMAFFVYEDGVAQYDGHVHSVDREKAERALENCPVVDEVDMAWTGSDSAQEDSHAE